MTTTNQYALITGATSGIGRACAYKLAENGVNVVLLGRRAEKLKALQEELTQRYKVECLTFCCDVTDREAIAEMKSALDRASIFVGYVINNAGLAAGLETIQDADIDDFEAMLDTNVKGLLYITKQFLPDLIARNQGHVVNVGSISGRGVYSKGAVYCATKHAVAAISQGLRLDIMGTAVKVTEVAPGLVETEFSLVRHKGDEDKANQTYEGMKPLSPMDVAETIWFCLSQPPHVNINEVVLTPIAQAGMATVHRK